MGTNHVCTTIVKSTSASNVDIDGFSPFMGKLDKPYSLELLETLVRESSILPQCINAYKRNIVGFGIYPKFIDENIHPTYEMEQEFKKLEEILLFLSLEKPLKEVFENMIDEREMFGYSFIEVIQNQIGEVVEISNLDSSTIEILPKDECYTDYTIKYGGKSFLRKRRFRKFRQKVNNQTVYFKEFGDPRVMDMITGKISDDVPISREANSLIHFKIGYGPYGTPRWEGPMLTVSGARSAEKLNFNYFKKGRHTPLMIIVKGGTLTKDSWGELQQYIDGIEGENGQHSFLVLEAEKLQPNTPLEETDKIDVEIKPLAEILQKDELFQGYLENHRRKVQSSFNLPDIYVGYSQDYNVATAREATKKTEEQVFMPERESLEWILNNKILAEYNLKYVRAAISSPDMENTELQSRMFAIASKGMTPNRMLKEYYDSVNKQYDIIEEDWADLPQYVYEKEAMQNLVSEGNQNIDGVINKAIKNNEDDEIISVLKSVKKALIDINDKIYP